MTRSCQVFSNSVIIDKIATEKRPTWVQAREHELQPHRRARTHPRELDEVDHASTHHNSGQCTLELSC
jgi:hypothetical protein